MRLDEADRQRLKGKPLSTAEQKVLEGVRDGLQNKEIAKKLGVTQNTVKTQLQRIYAKLVAKNRPHAVDRAYQVGYYKVRRRDL